MVVFDVVSGAPVFYVETKTVWDKLTKGVFRQMYDQLCEMQAKGHPNPFGALTCFDGTHILWLDNDSSKCVLDNLAEEGYGTDRLERIVRGLPGAYDDAALDTDATASRSEQQFTKSPVKEKEPADAQFSKDGFTRLATRNVTRSAAIPPEDMVAAFVSAIFFSLDGFQNPREIKSFQLDQKVEEEALCLNKTSFEWGTFRTTYRGPAKKGWFRYPKSLYFDNKRKRTTISD
jgi:hypothetical protein